MFTIEGSIGAEGAWLRRELALPPCCVGPRRMFVLFGVGGGWAVEPKTVIAVEWGP